MEPMDAHDELLDDAEERVELARRLLYARVADAFKPGTAVSFRVAAKTMRGEVAVCEGEQVEVITPAGARVFRHYRKVERLHV